MATITATEMGLAKLDVDNLGTELWLCEHPAAAEEALAAGGEGGLDDAAKACGQCVVLRAHWGNDIPADDEAGAAWLADLLTRTTPADRDEVGELVREWWLQTERRAMARRGLYPL